MPIFDYQCPNCKKVKEYFTKNTDISFTCSDCGIKMDKLFSGKVSFKFEGFGFPDNDRKLFSPPSDAKEKLMAAGFKEEKKKNNMDVVD